MPALFQLGKIVATQGVNESIPTDAIVAAIKRHVQGDWGDVCKEDAETNNHALKHGFRILSAYAHEGTKFWVLTEHSRILTTILLPDEY